MKWETIVLEPANLDMIARIARRKEIKKLRKLAALEAKRRKREERHEMQSKKRERDENLRRLKKLTVQIKTSMKRGQRTCIVCNKHRVPVGHSVCSKKCVKRLKIMCESFELPEFELSDSGIERIISGIKWRVQMREGIRPIRPKERHEWTRTYSRMATPTWLEDKCTGEEESRPKQPEAISLKMHDSCQTLRCPLCSFMILPDDDLLLVKEVWHHKICVDRQPALISKEGIRIRCPRCSHTWLYIGKSNHTSCGKCRASVRIRAENLVLH